MINKYIFELYLILFITNLLLLIITNNLFKDIGYLLILNILNIFNILSIIGTGIYSYLMNIIFITPMKIVAVITIYLILMLI